MKRSGFILNILKIAFWIAFIGAILTTILMFSILVIALVNYNSDIISHLDMSLPISEGTFSDLKNLGKMGFCIITFLIVICGILQSYLISVVLKILKKINFNHPFSEEISNLLSRIVSIAIITGIISIIIGYISDYILRGNVHFIENFETLIFAGIIYIIGMIYKKGLQLQSENDLTI